MPTFIKVPNLPEKPVRTVLLSADAPEFAFKRLESLDFEVICVPACEELERPVSAHPDMQLHHLGDSKIVCHKQLEQSFSRKLAELGFNLIMSEQILKPEYPFDIALNAARIGSMLFCKSGFTDRVITDFCSNHQIHIKSVQQGYAKCSVCIVGSQSIITADRSIEHAAKDCGMDVLLIQPGFINLPGYNTGFFGGCCGKLSADRIFVCGDLRLHPDCERIRNFLTERKIELEMISGEPLTDIGSLIPLLEEAQ